MSFNYISEAPSKEQAYEAMKEAAAEFRRADFGVVNLENVFGVREDYTPIVKTGPNLILDEGFIEYINALSPTVVNMANNHTKDYGDEAFVNTVRMMRQ